MGNVLMYLRFRIRDLDGSASLILPLLRFERLSMRTNIVFRCLTAFSGACNIIEVRYAGWPMRSNLADRERISLGGF